MYTHLEDCIYDLLRDIRITKPKMLTVENVSKKLGLNLEYRRKSFKVYDEIVLEPSTKQQEWQHFGHELGHFLRHAGSQLNMHYLFIDLQEYQANHFAYHFCVPTFMLENENDLSVYNIMDLFNVEYEFALRRLEMYERKVMYARTHC